MACTSQHDVGAVNFSFRYTKTVPVFGRRWTWQLCLVLHWPNRLLDSQASSIRTAFRTFLALPNGAPVANSGLSSFIRPAETGNMMPYQTFNMPRPPTSHRSPVYRSDQEFESTTICRQRLTPASTRILLNCMQPTKVPVSGLSLPATKAERATRPDHAFSLFF